MNEYILLSICLSDILTPKEERIFSNYLKSHISKRLTIKNISIILSSCDIDIIKISKITKYLENFNWDLFFSIYKLNKNFITCLGSKFPERLKEINDFPTIIFYKGDISLLSNLSLAVVGSRNNSIYSYQTLQKIIPELCNQNITIVSGLARGVDTISHQVTISSGGKTIAVLGNGIDYFYPSENFKLQKRIEQYGLVISEYPLGTKPKRYHFPARNRIIAAISHGVLIAEVKKNSGSLITASLAVQYNRNVYAIPGPITSSLAEGTNDLINDGCTPVLSAQSIMNDLFYFN